MRILMIVHQFFPEFTAGTEVLTLNTAKELADRGNQVLILSTRHSENPKIDRELNILKEIVSNLSVWKVEYNYHQAPNPLTLEYYNPEMKEFFITVIKEFKPDIAHIMHAYRFSSSIIDAFNIMKVPIVMTATDFWSICPRIQLRKSDGTDCEGPKWSSSACIKCIAKQNNSPEAKWLNKAPNVILGLGAAVLDLIHNTTDDRIKAVQFLYRRRLFLKKKVNEIKSIIVPTEIMRSMMEKNGISSTNLIKLHFGIETNNSFESVPIKEKKKKTVFGYIGTITEHKGAHLAVEAFNLLSLSSNDAELRIYGDIELDPSYTKHLLELAGNNSKIAFMGTFPNAEIASILNDIDVLVVPSIWYENTPLVLFSAFASKVPIIATDIAGLTEVVKDEINGLVFLKNDVVMLGRQMQRFLDENLLLTTLSKGITPVKTISDYVNDLENIYLHSLQQTP